jgi:N-acetylmuramoyl-L-alanine amidase
VAKGADKLKAMIETLYPSPNFSSRGDATITMIVLHDTEGSAQGALRWLSTPPAQRPDKSASSCHVLIDKAGVVYRLINDDKKAWHVRDYNSLSLGVELEMLPSEPPGTFTAPQLDSCVQWVAEKCNLYVIPLNRVVSHASLDPSRRTDPRGFDWFNFLLRVADRITNG